MVNKTGTDGQQEQRANPGQELHRAILRYFQVIRDDYNAGKVSPEAMDAAFELKALAMQGKFDRNLAQGLLRDRINPNHRKNRAPDNEAVQIEVLAARLYAMDLTVLDPSAPELPHGVFSKVAQTLQLMGYECTPESIQRLMRDRTDRWARVNAILDDLVIADAEDFAKGCEKK